ncbi:sodium/pantothenate symporter [Serratia symbiotica]|uniref:sodium/pantothenate symporter n=1 Tax=Serratia symbiotica TaxID=138074 RepID=UPI0030D1ABF0|nr:sodium/pantothenate symporter [Serratia symbiotica]
MQTEVVVTLIAYLLLVFGLSIYAYGHRQSGNFLNEYFLGNRSMGSFMLAMIQLPAAWLSLGVLGKKFAILARCYNAITLNDMLYGRFQSRMLVWLASLSLLVAFLGAMTVQFIGGARLLESAVGIPYNIGLLIFGISIMLYTAFGGFRAGVLNDAMQGLVMLLGTVLLLGAVINAADGLHHAVDKLQQIDPALVSHQGGDQILSLQFMASFWVLVCFGVIGLPHTAVRCISYKDSKAVHCGIILSTVVVALLMLGMHLAGALGRAVLPDLKIPDQVIPMLMVTVLPPYAAGIFLAAPLAAIMSTINAQLLQSSATIVKDLYLGVRPQHIDSARMIKRLYNLTTLILGLLVLLAAWHPPEIIICLNLLAFGGLEAVFLWPLVLGLYWRANAQGVLSSMLSGAICSLLASFGLQPAGLHPILHALLLSLLGFYIGNVVGEKLRVASYLAS